MIISPPFQQFKDRADGGRALAKALSGFAGRVDSIVLALPRGGVPVAHEVSMTLSIPLDIWLVRKLGVPGHEEYAMGALAANDVLIFNEDVLQSLNIDQDSITAVIDREQTELERRNALYRAGRPPPDVSGKTVIVIDDGFATGATMKAAIKSLQESGAGWIVAAAPVGAQQVCAELGKLADEVICPCQPEPFHGVGNWYRDFRQVPDHDVLSLLQAPMPRRGMNGGRMKSAAV